MDITKFLLRRFVQAIIVIWGIVTVIFFIRFITPGNPASTLVPPTAGEAVRDQLRQQLGLGQPIYIQYGNYLWDLIHLNFGRSLDNGRPVLNIILGRLPATIELALAATFVAIIFAIPLGVISARRRHEPVDYSATLFSLIGISTPNFWLGLMLIILIGVHVDFIPIGGRTVGVAGVFSSLMSGNFSVLGKWLAELFLPAITLGTYFTALITRLTRSGMLEELGEEYVKASRAKGLPETLLLYKRVLRNTLIPIITVLGLQLGTLIGGAVITEVVFAWPGLGNFLIYSINIRDWPTIQGTILVIGIGFVIINIFVDLTYAYLDPQVMIE
jgi:peptide/nickel transport system permease protein